MSRSVSLMALVAALGSVTPALAADWEGGWEPRGSFTTEPKDWTDLGQDDDTLGFEFGLRYWYSLGAQSLSMESDTFTANDQAHILEGHLRIDDKSTQTYAKALVGYSVVINGGYDNDGVTGVVTDGNVAYIGADLGYNVLGDDNVGVGVLAGYQYWADSPNTGRRNFTTATVGQTVPNDALGQPILGGDSSPNDLHINALRLGLQGRADFGGFMDVTAELAAVPYAHVGGVLGVAGMDTEYDPVGNITLAQSSATEINGWGYGAMGEVMVGFRPMENVTFRVGGRAWYLQGTADTTFDTVTVADAQDTDADPTTFEVPATVIGSQRYISTANPFSLFRYGLLAELSYKF